MNVKSIDIARALGISKSTVSLALNGKPGVSEQTRQEVLACKKQLEEHGVVPPGMFSRQPEQRKRQQIKIVKITNGMKNIQGAGKICKQMDIRLDYCMQISGRKISPA